MKKKVLQEKRLFEDYTLVVKNLLKLIALIVVVALGLALMTERSGGISHSTLLGWPLVVLGENAAKTFSWLAVGQVASGVLALGQGAIGVVAIGQGGVGVVFGLGQLATGLLAVGQLALGLFGCLAQLGFGLQGGFGLMWERDKAVLSSLNEELGEVLAWPWPRTAR